MVFVRNSINVSADKLINDINIFLFFVSKIARLVFWVDNNSSNVPRAFDSSSLRRRTRIRFLNRKVLRYTFSRRYIPASRFVVVHMARFNNEIKLSVTRPRVSCIIIIINAGTIRAYVNKRSVSNLSK